MGLVIVTPEGKEAKTIFKRLSYDAKRGQSVVHCECLRVKRRRVKRRRASSALRSDVSLLHGRGSGSTFGRGLFLLVHNG